MPIAAFAAEKEDIVILYENDVHCVIEGYSKLAALKKELQETYTHVGVVSGGDYIQGNSLGAISQGEYIVELMNLVGYDAVTLGNLCADAVRKEASASFLLARILTGACNRAILHPIKGFWLGNDYEKH